MAFHERLMELRKSRGWSQEELGDRLGVTRQTVSKWELGQTTPEMDKLIEISRIFNVSIDELTGNVREEPFTAGIPLRRPVFRYEYRSRRTLFGLPLLHINIGPGIYRAKGIVAFGTIARGVLAFGVLSMGLISFGALSLGLLAFGGLSAGLLALGGIAVGGVAIGGAALGYIAMGGLAVGVYSIGGCAIASNIAMGGYAAAHIAIGDQTKGAYTFWTNSGLSGADSAQIRALIQAEFPRIHPWLLEIFTI